MSGGDAMAAMRLAVATLALLHGVAVHGQADPVPKHLTLARELVENIKPEDNRYRLGGFAVTFPGDVFSSKYSVNADCSGFVLALFDRAGYRTQSRMSYLDGGYKRRRPASEDFVHSIEHGAGFQRILDVREARAGDVLAHAMTDAADKLQAGTTGHVLLINSVPRPIEPLAPVVEGTQQYEVSVIDTNEEWTGPDDTRLSDPANKVKGAGRGTLRLYADAEGQLVGFARTFKGTKRFFSYSARFPSDTRLRKAAIGRPL
jgi:hypothetical protein